MISNKNKPLFRWIVGDVSFDGLRILHKSIQSVAKLYKNEFDFLVCSNASDVGCKKRLQSMSDALGVQIYEQSWADLPISQSAVLKEFDINANIGIPQGRQGTFWKMCPPRMRLNSHEIVCDNDILIVDHIDKINEFLESDKVLLMKEDAFCVGKYFSLFEDKESYNSGLYGLPPYYDFAEDLRATWKDNGEYHSLLWRDEQGLITATLKKQSHITITEIVHLFNEGRCSDYKFETIDENKIKSRVMKSMTFSKHNFSLYDKGYHFLGVNRQSHAMWHEYQLRTL